MVALKTFNNLSPEKQKVITNFCLSEFSIHEYEAVSLTSIIKKMNISKGGFYRYFESKQSLYYFLLDHCTSKRQEFASKADTQNTGDIFELNKILFRNKIEFDRKFPLESGFLFRALHEKNNEELGDIQGAIRRMVMESILVILKNAPVNVIRNDIDLELAAFVIFKFQILINEYLEYKHPEKIKIDLTKGLYQIEESIAMRISDQCIEILKGGLSNQKSKHL